MPNVGQADGFGRDNRMVAALPDADYQRVRPYLEFVTLTLGQVVAYPTQPIEYLYFPTTALISLLHSFTDGTTAEVGITGNEGAVGIAVFLGGVTTPNQAVVQAAGAAVRVPTAVVQAEFARGETFQQQLLRYTQALITQISQTAICNRVHPVAQRFCRWLLISHDHVPSDQLIMTQELIAMMLGGRRESVTVAAGQLQDAGLIRYRRGHITIVDRAGLEATVCECYGVVKDEYSRLLGAP